MRAEFLQYIIMLKYIKYYKIDIVELSNSDIIEIRLEDNSENRWMGGLVKTEFLNRADCRKFLNFLSRGKDVVQCFSTLWDRGPVIFFYKTRARSQQI